MKRKKSRVFDMDNKKVAAIHTLESSGLLLSSILSSSSILRQICWFICITCFQRPISIYWSGGDREGFVFISCPERQYTLVLQFYLKVMVLHVTVISETSYCAWLMANQTSAALLSIMHLEVDKSKSTTVAYFSLMKG